MCRQLIVQKGLCIVGGSWALSQTRMGCIVRIRLFCKVVDIHLVAVFFSIHTCKVERRVAFRLIVAKNCWLAGFACVLTEFDLCLHKFHSHTRS